MKALIVKEVREGWSVVLFGGGLSVVVMLLYALLPVWFREPEIGADFADGLLAILPPVLAAVAGSTLFAREQAEGTLPLLLALPLSRNRIWGAKVIAGLALAFLSALLLLIPAGLVVMKSVGELAFLTYAREIAIWSLVGFVLTIMCSTLAERPFNALLVGLLALIGLFVGAVWIVGVLGGSLFGSDPFLDISLWGVMTVPPFLLASALTLRHGELLFRRRKWAIALPTATIVFALLVAVTVGVARVATRYARSEVKQLSICSTRSDAPVIALATLGQPVSLTDLARYRGSQVHESPVYRSRNLVLLDTRAGKEVLVQRVATRDEPLVAISRDGRYAAVIAGAAPLTWGERGETGPEGLTIWDLQKHRQLYRGMPQYALDLHGIAGRYALDYLSDVSWSPDGAWLAVSAAGALIVMRPDGTAIGGAPLALASLTSGRHQSYTWGQSGRDIYFLDKDARLTRWAVPNGPKQVIWAPGKPAKQCFWLGGEMSASPDGKWIAISLESVARDPVQVQRKLPTPPGEVASWWVVAAADGSGAKLVEEMVAPRKYDPLGGESAQFTWSADSRRLYLVVPDEEHRRNSVGRFAKLLYWTADRGRVEPVVGLPVSSSRQMAAVPDTNELLIWRGPRGQPVLVVGNDGCAEPSANTRIQEASLGNGLLGVDAGGRAILYSYPVRSLSTLDLATGDLKRVYP